MFKVFTKNMCFVLLLIITGSQVVHAEVKNYQYDGKLPFVQMMLNMMTAMGILDRIPTNGGRYGNYGRYGSSAFSNSPWSQSAFGRNVWDSNGVDAAPWGNPTWGVLPPESYALDGWVNEPWETSQWNPQRQTSNNAPQNSSNAVQQNQNNVTQYQQSPHQPSPLARIARPDQPNQANQQWMQSEQPVAQSNRSSSNTIKQKPCITEFCGLKKPNLNGLWVSRDGEMLGIKNNNYLWSDGNTRYLTGKIKTQNEYLLTSIEGTKQVIRFKYKLSGNRLLTVRPNGNAREFVRMSASQYQNYNRLYNQGYNEVYDLDYN